MNIEIKPLIVSICAFLVVSQACLAQQNHPSWIDNPPQSEGISTVACVKHQGNLSISRSKASAKARGNLTRQIEANISALEKYLIVDNEENYSSHVDSSSAELLRGSRVVKSSLATYGEHVYFCALMESSAKTTKKVFDLLMASNQDKVDGQQREHLFRQFVHEKNANKFTH